MQTNRTVFFDILSQDTQRPAGSPVQPGQLHGATRRSSHDCGPRVYSSRSNPGVSKTRFASRQFALGTPSKRSIGLDCTTLEIFAGSPRRCWMGVCILSRIVCGSGCLAVGATISALSHGYAQPPRCPTQTVEPAAARPAPKRSESQCSNQPVSDAGRGRRSDVAPTALRAGKFHRTTIAPKAY